MVVIVVVSVLAAILLPVLAKSKVVARRIQCVSNLHQMGLAANLYSDDHQGRALRYGMVSTNNGMLYWFGWVGRGPNRERIFDPTQGALHSYLDEGKVKVCPAFENSFKRLKLKPSGSSYGYGYNRHLSRPGTESPLRMAAVEDIVGTAMFADSAQVNAFRPPATPTKPLLEERYYITDTEATTHFRHQELANTVFCDGHVAAERPRPDSIDLRVRGEVVGALPSELLDWRRGSGTVTATSR